MVDHVSNGVGGPAMLNPMSRANSGRSSSRSSGGSSSSRARRSQNGSSRRRIPSPVMLPPRWGQEVAPPPTPLAATPNTSPPQQQHPKPKRNVDKSHRRDRSHRHSRPGSAWSSRRGSPIDENDIVSYTYRFSDDREEGYGGICRDAMPPPLFVPPQPPPPLVPYADITRGPIVYHQHAPFPARFAEDYYPTADDERSVTFARYSSHDGGQRRRMPSSSSSSARRLQRHQMRQKQRMMQQQQRRHAALAPPPNSQSTSPVTTGSSPEAAVLKPDSVAFSQSSSPVLPHRLIASSVPDLIPLSSAMRASAMRSNSTSWCPSLEGQRMMRVQHQQYPRPAKSVQWMADVKRRPEDISADRRVVKHQVNGEVR